MSSRSILLIGAGGHAISCIDVIEQHGEFEVAGMTGSAEEVGTTILGYRVLGTDAELPSLVGRYGHALIAVGQIKSPELRIRLFEYLVRLGSAMPPIVSPRAYVSPRATLGAGTIVMHGAIVNAGASIGRNCILNSLSLVEHNTTIADHCHIATAAVVNGEVSIGTGTFVGSNSEVRQGVRIGERCLIGMGQRVLADCPTGTKLPPSKERV
jgi:sugar O-acyltransferase (sialic acid O-acetyltransferase NeuD family)